MRLLVVNPNASAAMTQRIGAAARAVAGPGVEVAAVNPAHGPASIEGYFDEVFAAPGLVEEVAKGDAAGFDAFVVACFDDTGLEAARCSRARAGDRRRRGGVSSGVADRPSLQRRHHAVALDRADRGQFDEIRSRVALCARARL